METGFFFGKLNRSPIQIYGRAEIICGEFPFRKLKRNIEDIGAANRSEVAAAGFEPLAAFSQCHRLNLNRFVVIYRFRAFACMSAVQCQYLHILK